MELEVSEHFLTKMIRKLMEAGVIEGGLRSYQLGFDQVSIVGLTIRVLKTLLKFVFRIPIQDETAKIIVELAFEFAQCQIPLIRTLVYRAITFLTALYQRAQAAICYTMQSKASRCISDR